ncbi:hypothetical protein [Streptomyces sp. NPDC048560]|uniref:hypothetical protein n=1 Tax=Streptomyces sp. NPDC048560 TaxID=3155488 RepID=UPI00343E6E68
MYGAFAARLGTPAPADVPDADITQASLACLLRGHITLPAHSEVFALHPAGLTTADVRLVTASDGAG